MSQEPEAESRAEADTEMSADEVASKTQDLLLDLYDDRLLNDCHEALSAGRVEEAMQALGTGLNERYLDSSGPEWKSFVQLCLAHPIRELLHQDPFTSRAFLKPRGYPGDAVLLDFIYGVDDDRGPPEGTSDLGSQIFQFTTRTALCNDMRLQARMIAGMIDTRAENADSTEVLAVAAGHLREADLSAAFARKKISRWVAFDSDTESLSEVRQSFGGNGVETLAGTVRRLVAGKVQPGTFDVIYSTGLYGYLEQPVAKRLTMQLFDMLRPGGRLLIAVILTDVSGRGYMESFMDWQLNYRTRDLAEELAGDIDPALTSDVRLTTEGFHHLAILDISKP